MEPLFRLVERDDSGHDPVQIEAALLIPLGQKREIPRRQAIAIPGDAEIAAEAKSFKSENLTARGRGRAVLAAATDLGSDVLVMGAFGESQISALLGLGRATEKIVTACKIPVLVQA